MGAFAASFLLLFYQVALGGLFALAATPFHELERGFYKSTAGVLLVVGVLGLLGKLNLFVASLANGLRPAAVVELLLYALFVLCSGAYVLLLWGEQARLRARAFTLSLFTGLAGLAAATQAFYEAPLFSLETIVYPLSFLLSALVLGGVTVGMLIGHWYLIDTGQSIEPFVRMYKFFLISLLFQIGSFLILPPLLYLLGSPTTLSMLRRLWEQHQILLWSRLVIGGLAPLILAAMIWRTLKIPHTMAATGLFYIALLGVFVGEILGRQILAVTSLPF